MSTLVDENTRLIVQGIGGIEGRRHALACAEYGTRVVGGISPTKDGSYIDGIPVFGSVSHAREATGANASMIFVPANAVLDAIAEALDAGIETIVCITEGVPILDMVKTRRILNEYPASRLIGPNCPGVISPGKAKVGIMPGYIHSPGRIGVVSRSGTLMYEAVGQLTAIGLGQSTCIGIGGDPLPGTSFTDALRLFEADPETEAVLLIGEIGGSSEEEAAGFIASSMTKPVVAYIAGAVAPEGRRMGHAGAVAGATNGNAAAKKASLMAAGVIVAADPASIGEAVALMADSAVSA